MVKIKLCGLRTEEDVRCAVRLGVDAVGFVLSDSPREVSPAEASRLRELVPNSIRTHAVFGPEEPDVVKEKFTASGLDIAQVHGPDEDDYWQALVGIPFIRAFRVKGDDFIVHIEWFISQFSMSKNDTFLLDAYVPGVVGGTGETFDWKLAREASRFGRVILAGGLDEGNVAEAVRVAQPYMVDVSGGIESSKGVKDHVMMERFVAAVRATKEST